MGKKFKVIKQGEFLRWLSRRGKYREFNSNEYKLDLNNCNKERREENKTVNERCYVISLGNNRCFKLYSSIDRGTNETRAKGKDSIKIVLAEETSLEPKLGKLKHIERIYGWEENADKTILEALEKLWPKKIVRCTKCRHGKLIIRHNRPKDVTFLGCTQYKQNEEHSSFSLDQIWKI